MPELKLGTKYDCYNCGTKFYDLGKPEPVCPKCGANQKDAVSSESQAAGQASRRRRKAETVAKAIDLDDEETPIEAPEIADDEMVEPDLVDADLDDDEEEEELDDED
jgi:uncharacterized protein (TIGR02300 family)